MNNTKQYKEPRNIVDKDRYLRNNRTNESGVSVFYLGGNNYNIIATSKSNDSQDEKIISLKENSVTQVTLDLS
ncbi:hypothetical protein AKJ58_01415 [candidate division MSBL1 archaeon SCGC-AAA385D11]|uniref:Uncharacterized protein n=1 Tax=candidate division MSBL1 archaeon SCGC-AAA385D11 TaxID=1698286 RepID=A0A133VNA2_9EURY|nr:hypothetical protein AKJ58_01415 [candidate division MSBL1 archaeon SCGC-AAA385D11]